MAKLNLPPTRSSFLKLSKELSFADEGFELLEQKRQILLIELMGLVASAKRTQDQVREKMAAAYEAVSHDLANTGALKLNHEALSTSTEQCVELGERYLMGITLPEVMPEHNKPGPSFGLGEGSVRSDEVVRKFFDALESISRLAEIESSVVRLARELKKTQRRVNALEKIFIPDYSETIKYIEDSLAERERDAVVIMRMIKKR